MKKRKASKKIWWIVAAVGVLGLGAATAWFGRGYLFKEQAKTTETPKQTVQQPTKPTTPSLTFAAMGDMLAHDSVVNNAKTADGYDFTTYFSKIKPYFAHVDVTFCNPETLAAGTAFGVSGYPAFNAPTEFARDLSKVGCNVINLATNHINDKGQAALNATVAEWEKLQPLAFAGANRSTEEQGTVRYFTKNDIKVAFVAFADFSNNRALTEYALNSYHNTALVTKLMTEARANADVVLVSAHWGTEDSGAINTDQQTAAQVFADFGADVVIGTGPHVLQKVSELTGASGRKTLVWYSIGNMLNSQLGVNGLTSGVAGFTVEKATDGIVVKNLTFKSTFMSYDWPAADRAAGTLSTRSNLMLYPLAEAGNEVTKFGATLNERINYVRQAIGNEVLISFTP